MINGFTHRTVSTHRRSAATALAPSVSNTAARGYAPCQFRPGRSLSLARARMYGKMPANHSHPILYSALPSLARKLARFEPARRREGRAGSGGDKWRPVRRIETEPNRGANRRETIAQTRTATRVPVTARAPKLLRTHFGAMVDRYTSIPVHSRYALSTAGAMHPERREVRAVRPR